MSDDRKAPSDLLADVFVYAPLGFASELLETFPRLVTRGRERATLARLIGQVAVVKGQQKLASLIDQVFAQPEAPAPRSSGAASASPAPVSLDEPDPDVEQPIVVRHLRPTYDLDEAALLAIPDYDSLAASQVVPRLAGLTSEELEAVRKYESAHRARRTILGRVAQLQQSA